MSQVKVEYENKPVGMCTWFELEVGDWYISPFDGQDHDRVWRRVNVTIRVES